MAYAGGGYQIFKSGLMYSLLRYGVVCGYISFVVYCA